MADLDAVHLGLDENEADIAEELQDFDDSFDTRSEASDTGSDSSDSQPSISSVSTSPSSIGEQRPSKTKKKDSTAKTQSPTEKRAEEPKKSHSKRTASPSSAVNGKSTSKKQRKGNDSPKAKEAAPPAAVEGKKSSSGEAKKSRKKSTSGGANGSTAAATAAINSSKSDNSDTEKKSTVGGGGVGTYDSDSESEDSDAEANVKRNGRKAAAKSVSPEKKTSSAGGGCGGSVGVAAGSASGTGASGTGGSSSGGKSSLNKSYDYMTKLNYLFRDTRFFLIKSNNADNIALSKSKNVWATLPQNDANLNQAFKEARNVLLIFSVNESGKFAGFARMGGHSRRDIPQVAWVLPPSISSKALGGVIEIDWICRKELSFNCTSHLYNTWNENKPVKIGRDGQEIEPKVGAELCRLFPEDEKIELTPILRKSKETAKMMREKGIRVVYKQPSSLSTRGGGRGGGGGGGGGGGFGGGYRHGERRDGRGGPMRHKRSFGGPHRPYKLGPMGPPPGGFKRNSPPYRGGGPGPGGGMGSRAGGGDVGMPPWERYMTSAAAAEAYVADYMRTMHGQLPPLPFVPPFAQLPLAASGSGAIAASGAPAMYEQMPPPVRYYDGPPMPDYAPSQALRPPPPNFDKAPPSYEDFAAWKNAGLPTAPGAMPPGFPGFGNGGGGGANAGSGVAVAPGGNNSAPNFGGNSAGGASAGGPMSYRNRESSSNSNRSRERGGRANAGSSSRSGGGGDRERHFRAGGNRNYRDARR